MGFPPTQDFTKMLKVDHEMLRCELTQLACTFKKIYVLYWHGIRYIFANFRLPSFKPRIVFL